MKVGLPKLDPSICPHAHPVAFTTFTKCDDCAKVDVTDESSFYEERGPGAFNDAHSVLEAKERATRVTEAIRQKSVDAAKQQKDKVDALQLKEDRAFYQRQLAEHREMPEILEDMKRRGWTPQRMADALDILKERIKEFLGQAKKSAREKLKAEKSAGLMKGVR